MKSILTLIISLVIATSISGKSIVDMTGRTLVVPDNITKILPYDVKTSVMLFSVAKDKMIARSMLAGNKTYKLIHESYNTIPEVDIKNLEEVLLADPEVIVAGVYGVQKNIDSYVKLQKRTNIPVIIIDLSLTSMDKTYLFLGDVLDKKEICEVRADYLKGVYEKAASFIDKQKPTESVYYTLGNNGLMTDPSGSKHTEVLDYLNVDNAAKISIPTGGHAKVNLEQVLIWSPEIIFCGNFKGNNNAYKKITEDEKWQSIPAVKNNRVYRVPGYPFGWFDHPPSVNRIPAILWLGEIFYDQPADLTCTEIQKFYKLFYDYDLTKEEYASLFN